MITNFIPITIRNKVQPFFFITIGSLLMAIALSLFLVPNLLLDGGITGISIIIAYLSPIPLSLLLLFLNLPFIYIGYKYIGKKFTFYSCYSILLLSFFINRLHFFPPLTTDLLLATFFGGVLLGCGVGLVIRNGAALDGTEILSILLSKKTSLSIGKIILFFNLFIYTFSAFIFGWDRAMYSILCYIIAAKTMDLIIYYFEDSKTLWIVSDKSKEVGDAILLQLKKGVTYLNGEGAFSREDKKIIFCVIHAFEETDLKKLVYELDPCAFITVATNSYVEGGFTEKKSHLSHL